ncbi:MAG: serpin family protein [Planctomycetota bacterium]|nr:serpin family protein [Planctomycetota bacterium]
MIIRMTVVMLAAFTAASAQDQPPPAGKEPVQPKADVAAVAQADNVFGCELYARLKGQAGNLFFSPASIHTALAMTYAGAAGRTADQMAGALHFKLPADRLHKAFGLLTNELNNPPKQGTDPAYQLVVANALWLQKGYPFKESFTRLVKDSYSAGLNEVDYAAPEPARKTINDWLEKATGDKITDLIPPGVLNELTRLVLTNAVYFKSDWAAPFSKQKTKDGPFQLGEGNTVNVPLMTQWTHVGYMETKDFQLADLPYKANELSMTVLLPRKADGLKALEDKLSAKALAQWIGKAKVTYVDLTVPRFKFTSQFGLKEPLSQLGMVDAFDPRRANFSGMTTMEKLFISAVLHNAFVAVDEEGTEAAAATAVTVTALAVPEEPKIVFRADRPFLFLIRHRPTGAVLFLGRLANPGA